MKQYWPNAVALDYQNKPSRLFTYDSCESVKDCGEVFKCWQDKYDYSLLSTWIEVVEGEKRDCINHRCYVNAIGQVKKI